MRQGQAKNIRGPRVGCNTHSPTGKVYCAYNCPHGKLRRNIADIYRKIHLEEIIEYIITSNIKWYSSCKMFYVLFINFYVNKWCLVTIDFRLGVPV